MTDKQERLQRLKVELKYLSSKAVEGSITQTEKMRLTMVRNEIRILERQFMQRIA